jgi:hypothetical protein
MRNIFLLLFLFLLSLCISAQEIMQIHKKDTVFRNFLSDIDSIYFSDNGTVMHLNVNDSTLEYAISDIDSITFENNSGTVYINYNGLTATVIKPTNLTDIDVSVEGANVIIYSHSQLRDITYSISGKTEDGMLKIYSDKRFNLDLNEVNITNTLGPAINIQSKNKVTVTLVNGTKNYITDGNTYLTGTEDQKATFFSEGQIIFQGNGMLTVISNSQHGICSDDYVRIDNGEINITAKKDGVHSSDYFEMNGGILNINSGSDGIDCENGYIAINKGNITITGSANSVSGIKSDSIMTILGGKIDITEKGDNSKALKSSKNMILKGGIIIIKTSGNVILETLGSGYNPAYCTAIKCDSDLIISGSNISITSTGKGAKGISANYNIEITDGSVNIENSGTGTTFKNTSGITDAYSASCINTDKNLNIIGGNLILKSTGAGGKGLKADGSIIIGNSGSGPNLSITTTGSKFTVSSTSSGSTRPGETSTADYCHPKTIVSTGAITINNGTVNISSSDDAIHSETSITINGGTISINNSVEGIESKIITLNNGTINMLSSNDGLNATACLTAGGTESNDGSYLFINGGHLVSNCTNGDAIDANGNIIINGGIIIANGPSNGVEEAVDFNGTFNMNGGLFIGSGSNSNMTKAMSSTSSQYNLYISSSSLISNTSFLNITDANGNEIITFKSKYGGYKFLFSSPLLKSGTSYSIFTGGSYSGGNEDNGIYSGGTFSGGTSKKTFTISNKVTTLSF